MEKQAAIKRAGFVEYIMSSEAEEAKRLLRKCGRSVAGFVQPFLPLKLEDGKHAMASAVVFCRAHNNNNNNKRLLRASLPF